MCAGSAVLSTSGTEPPNFLGTTASKCQPFQARVPWSKCGIIQKPFPARSYGRLILHNSSTLHSTLKPPNRTHRTTISDSTTPMDSKPAHRRSMTSQSTDDTKPSVTKRYRVAIFAPASLNSYQLKRSGILPGYRLIYKSNMKCKPDLKQLGGMPDGPYRAPSAIDNTSLPARADNRWSVAILSPAN